jgi:rifampicin phosphotransferase
MTGLDFATETTTFIRPLDAPDLGLAELGGKAASLARLVRAGLPVPDGFVVDTAAYRRFVTGSGLQTSIERRLADVSVEDPDQLSAAAADIRRWFRDQPLPGDIANPVRDAYKAMGRGRVAVRSSATAEDLPGLSFAGQQDSFLNIGHADGLLAAIRDCWASLWNERAISYRARQGVGLDGLAIAVIVQRLVNAESSGVMFTANPMTGVSRRILIESTWGLGEALVGGEVTPDRFEVGRRSLVVVRRDIATKHRMSVRGGSGTRIESVPDRLSRLSSLPDDSARQLARYGVQVAELYGTEMDIEWCRVGSQLFLLQARPITSGDGDARDPWNDSRTGNFLWTNTNVGEAIPDVMTPATWAMVQVFLSDAMATASIPPYLGYGRIGGRIYLNVSVMAALSGVVGVNERNFRSLTEEVFGRLPDDVEIPPVKVSWLQTAASVVPVAAHVLAEAKRDARRLDEYLAGHPQLCLERRAEIAAVTSGPDLARLWRMRIEPEFHRVSMMLSAATRSSGASFVTTRQRLQSLVGSERANAITAGLGSTDGQLASLGLLEGLDQLAAGEIDPATFNLKYGHRGPHEFEISVPRPAEDPAWIDAQLAARPADGPSFRDLLRRQEQARDKAWRTLEYDHPLQARLLGWQLRRWAEIARAREHARSEVIRYFWVLRSYVLRAGELTGLGDDIFFLDADEIVDALDGDEVDRLAIDRRRDAYQRYAALPPYPALISGRFDPFTWAADPDRRTDLHLARSGSTGGSTGRAKDSVTGFPGSAGVVEGRARVLTGAEQSASLEPGEVLVTSVTNVGWTPVFPRAAAVVTDVGAPLSHAAIVARELGIPAVVGCGNATMRIRTGDLVRVDGSAGLVDVLSRG